MVNAAPVRVVVAGALGRMGRAACAALAAAPGIDVVGRLVRELPAGGADRADRAGGHDGAHGAGGAEGGGGASPFFVDAATCYDATRPNVVVDFTEYPATLEIVDQALARRISPVIGATGRSPSEEDALAKACDQADVGAALVPNFALGAVLMMRFASEAARYFPSAEIVELHHDRKRDAPSGTARLTAWRMRAASGRDVPIHSVRLPGFVAHQEVLLGGEGEVLTIRHDSLSRESFMRGVVLAVRAVRAQRGLAIGLEPLLETAVPS